MKTALTIILIIVGGYAYYLQSSTRALVKERDDLTAKVEYLEEQHGKLTKDLKERDGELAAAREALEALESRVEVPPVAASRVEVGAGDRSSVIGEQKTVPMVPVVTAPNPEEVRKVKRLAQIDLELAALEAERTRGEAARANAVANPPTFAEQGDRVDGMGRVIGKKGVRTSDADRAKAMAAHEARIAAMDARLAEIAGEVEKLRVEAEGLR